MSEFDFSDVEVPEGVVKIDMNLMSPQQQFDNWMVLKGIQSNLKNSSEGIITNSVLRCIIKGNIDKPIAQEYTEVCFDRAGHDRSGGGGHDRNTFDRACAP